MEVTGVVIKHICILYAYILPLKFSSKFIDTNYFFYWFECFHMICPNLSSAPCIPYIFYLDFSLFIHFLKFEQ
jgi:hypothetical protein